jgi:Asp-tRNA(Asn)/Glu-tRNA(Gln) amidotransferase A subunit family amidase
MLWQAVTICNGPITRTVADAALMLDVLAGPDDRDPRSLCDGAGHFSDVVACESSIAGTRIAYLRDLGCVPMDPAVVEVCNAAIDAFEQLGCRIEEEDRIDFSDTVEAYGLINATRRAATIDRFLPERASELDPEVVWRWELAGSRTATDFGKAVVVQTSAYERVRGLLQQYDLLVTPTAPTPAFALELGAAGGYPHEIAGKRINNVFEQLALTFLFNLTGNPAISVPAGWTDEGLPVGLQIVGPWRDDAAVLGAAAAYERVRPWRDRWPPIARA